MVYLFWSKLLQQRNFLYSMQYMQKGRFPRPAVSISPKYKYADTISIAGRLFPLDGIMVSVENISAY